MFYNIIITQVMKESITITGARTHNLKNFDVRIPRNKLVVITGISGSGKSSLAFDTLYAEGQRRYTESLSAYARQFLSMMDKPDVDSIDGLSPAIAIQQKNVSHNPRSTVGTVTEIHDYLRLLYARIGTAYCPEHNIPLEAQVVSEMTDKILQQFSGKRIVVLSPVIRGRKGEYSGLLENLRRQGYIRARIDGIDYELDTPPKMDKQLKHDIDVIIDRLKPDPATKQRLADSLESALHLSDGLVRIAHYDTADSDAGSDAATDTTDADSNADTDAATDSDTDNDTHAHADTDSYTTDADSDADTDTDNDAHAYTDTDSDAAASTKAKKSKKTANKQANRQANKQSKPITFSSKFSCPECDYSIAELEPRLFSFNNPHGACATCQGLGNRKYFDPKNIVHPELSINEGAIRVWNSQTPYYFAVLQSVAKHYRIPTDKPFAKLKKEHQNILLYGSGNERIKFSMPRGSRYRRFEGVIPTTERRYRDSDSFLVQESLEKYMSVSRCPDCDGTRMCKEALNVRVEGKNLAWVNHLAIEEALSFFGSLKIGGKRGVVAEKILKEVRERLLFLDNVGLGYLSLERSADTLSGGESQRIRLASQIGSGLVGVLYVLDEPSIGLHQRDNKRLLDTLKRLRDLGNSVLVVEHDEETIAAADHLIDIGPGAGVHGGKLVAEGKLPQVVQVKESLTGDYLSGRKQIAAPKERKQFQPDKVVKISGAKGNNLADLEVEFPVGLFTCVTGVSGSGKSTLVNQTLYPIAAQKLNAAQQIEVKEHTSISGLEHLDKVINIDQSPIGRTPRSNPATYTGLFTPIRELFSSTEEARARGYNPGRFSFNVKGGRCEACQGGGVTKVEMHFLSDIYVPCDTCQGKRYGRETLEIKYRDKNIYEVLEMTVEDAAEFFANIPTLKQKLDVLLQVGLSYIKLGHSATLLSGGEAQRIKLSKELSRRNTGRTLYILDEPTTGLHFHDVKQLLHVLHELRDLGNSILVIEHNLDVIKTADWVIDMGPEGGSKGGRIIGSGTPEDLSKQRSSVTGQYLKQVLKRSAAKSRAKPAEQTEQAAEQAEHTEEPEQTEEPSASVQSQATG